MGRSRDKILQFIERYIHENEMPPTFREIQEHCGFSSIGTVQDHLKLLARDGLIKLNAGIARGITLAARATGIPILGRVPAGPAQLAFEEVEGYVGSHRIESHPPQSHSTMESTKGLFALRVKGDSMIEAGILEGDLVIVQQQSTAKNGDIVVARLNQEDVTVKRLVRKPGIIELAPANPKYKPIPVNETTEIVGKVVRIVRHYF